MEQHVCRTNLAGLRYLAGEVHRRKFCWAVKWQRGGIYERQRRRRRRRRRRGRRRRRKRRVVVGEKGITPFIFFVDQT